MAESEPGWELYRSFLAVLRDGTLSGAARRLGLTQPTIGRHVEALEQALALTLFTRSPQGLAATEAAQELRPYAEALEATTEALLRAASGHGNDEGGTVRVTASDIVGAEVLPPIIADLQRRYPKLAIELVLSNRNEDLLRREADVAIRMARPTQAALLARRIGSVELGLYAHRRYLRRRRVPHNVAEIAGHTVIGYDHETDFIRALRAKGMPLQRAMFGLRTDSDLAQLAALRAGCGIGACQVPLAARDRNLVRLLPDAFSHRLETWVVMHEDLRSSRRCRLVFDALAEGLATYLGCGAA